MYNQLINLVALEIAFRDPLISAHSFANLKDSLSEDIKWIMGDYDFDFSQAPAVREEVLTEQTVSDMAIWAVPALGALDIISTLLDISIFIAASSAQTEFYTLLATLAFYVSKI